MNYSNIIKRSIKSNIGFFFVFFEVLCIYFDDYLRILMFVLYLGYKK